MRARWLIPALALAVAGSVERPARADDSATVGAVGWWTRQPGAAAKAPGAFEVSLLPDGPVSVAAVGLNVEGTVTKATLALTELPDGLRQAEAVIEVCPITVAWTPANPGAFDSAPAATCTSPVQLARDGSGHWRGDVTAMVAGRPNPSLKLVPGASAVAFQVQVARAEVVAEFAPEAASPEPEPEPAPAGDQAPSSAPADVPGPVPDLTGTAGPLATTPAAGDPGSSAAAPTGTVDDRTPAELTPLSSRAGGDGDGDGTDRPWERLFFLVPLAAALGAGSVYARRGIRRLT